MAIIDGMLQELDQEAQTTRKVLALVPDEKLTWKPHEKARTLGQLALHIAMIPGSIAELVSSSAKTQVPKFTEPSPQTASELVSTLDASIGKAKQLLSKMDDGAIMETWSLMNGDKEVFSLPRVAV